MRHVACLLALLPASAFAVLSVTIQHNDATCWYSDGGAIAIPTGGVPPYTYEWSNGVTDQQIQWVAAGTYSVTVTDSNSDQVMEQVAILSLPYALQGDQGYAYCEVGGVVFPEFPFVVPTGGRCTVVCERHGTAARPKFAMAVCVLSWHFTVHTILFGRQRLLRYHQRIPGAADHQLASAECDRCGTVVQQRQRGQHQGAVRRPAAQPTVDIYQLNGPKRDPGRSVVEPGPADLASGVHRSSSGHVRFPLVVGGHIGESGSRSMCPRYRVGGGAEPWAGLWFLERNELVRCGQ
ncbi:MAG: SprB repeat-containing protein [Flavobacteriales bacterium]|nr:SprB repeat-containing protein [Flavobacteriales bacterium]